MAPLTTLAELTTLGIVDEIIRRFDTPDIGIALLHRLGWSAETMPVMGEDIEGFWADVLERLEANQVADGLQRLMEEIADLFPYLSPFARWRKAESLPEARKPTGAAMVVHVQGTVSPRHVQRLVDLFNRVLSNKMPGRQARLEYITAGSWNGHVHVENMTPAQMQTVWADLEDELRKDGLFEGISVFVRVCTHRFRDGFISQLRAELPDQSLRQINNAPLSMTTRDVGVQVLKPFLEEIDQAVVDGPAPRVTVDRREPDGATQRLRPEMTLLEARLQENSTLEIARESTAGPVHPQTREEALSRARVQVLEYAHAHPGFNVSANATIAPTEYLFDFTATGLQPPEALDLPPTDIHQHQVLLVLPADYPMRAPVALWQTPIFHPNIHPENGLVCLGELQDKYRPGLHFGQLCQILVDVATFRNYELSPFLNPEAARWVASPEGQQTLKKIGGRLWQQDLIERLVSSPIRLKMKRVDS